MEFLFFIDITLCIQFIIIAVILWFLKKGNIVANRLLGLFFVTIAVTNISFSLYFRSPPIFPHLLKVHLPVEYAIAPLLFLYLKALFERKFKFKRVYSLHFVPTLFFIVKEFTFFCQSADAKLLWNQNKINTNHHLLATLFYIQFAVYITLILIKLFRYSSKLKEVDTYSKTIKLWVKEVIIVVTILLSINIIPVFFIPEIMLLIPLITSIMYFLILYKVFFKPDIFVNLKISELVINDIKNYSNSKLDPETENELCKKLTNSIINEKIYINSDITLPGLAEMIQFPYHQLSRFINEKYNQNFNDFINSKRIEEVKKRLLKNDFQHLTIEAIGRSVGFNSKAAFYNSFKKFANCSPTQYKKSMSKQISEVKAKSE